MLDQVNEQIKAAMKSKNKEKLSALRMLKAQFIENSTSGQPKAESDVAIAHCKKLKDSLALFKGQPEEIAKIEKEIDYLKDFLPKPLEEGEVKSLIDNIISSQDKPAFNLVMRELSSKIKGKFDGKKAADLVKARFA